MEICNDSRHEEIVFDSRSCPLCEALDKIELLEDQLEEALKDVRYYENECISLQQEIDSQKE